MSSSRRLASLLLVLLLIGVPAAALSFACVGDACDEQAVVTPDVPFCTLPEGGRRLLEGGYYEGRSPEVFAVAKGEQAVGYGDGMKAAGAAPTWPNPASGRSIEVPILLWGEGVVPGELESQVRLDQIAPTLTAIAGLERGNEDVRSGDPIEGVWRQPVDPPSLLVLIALKGVSGELDLRSLRALAARAVGTTGSLPSDTAATLTTVGTGGLPSQHGITGSLIRNDDGRLVEAWGRGAPTSVIATLGDDLDEKSGQRALVGMIATDPTDRGLIGGNWYLDGDEDDFEVVKPREVIPAFERMLEDGHYGDDETTDLLAVTLEVKSERELEAQVSQMQFDLFVAADVHDATAVPTDPRVTVAMFGTGAASGPRQRMTGKQVVADVEQALAAPVVETAIPGGLFLDKEVMANEKLTTGKVMDALEAVTVPGTEEQVMLDAYPAFSVSFGRYCQP